MGLNPFRERLKGKSQPNEIVSITTYDKNNLDKYRFSMVYYEYNNLRLQFLGVKHDQSF